MKKLMNKKFTNFLKPNGFYCVNICDMDDFFDTNSLIIHNELSNDIDKLNNQKYFTNEINKDKSELKLLQMTQVSKNMREKLFMKKEMKIFFLLNMTL